MATSLHLLQWNCQSVFNKRQELEKRVENFENVLLSETWINSSDRFLFKHFDTVRNDRTFRRGRGTAMLIRNCIKYKLVNINFDADKKIEACAVSVFIGCKPVIIISLCRPDAALSSDEWELFFNQFQGNCLIGGDFNAHHSRWGDPRTDLQGRNLVEAMDKVGMFCMNTGSMTRSGHGNSQDSAVDLTISNGAAFLTARWEVISELWGSDHFPISIEVMGTVDSRLRFNSVMRIHSIKTDWKRVDKCLSDRIADCASLCHNTDLDFQTKYTTFMSLIEDCVKMYTPKRKLNNCDSVPSNHRRAVPWWDSDCEKASGVRKAAFLRFKFISSRDNYLKYKGADDAAKLLFKRKKKESFLQFCDSLNRQTNMKLVWQKIRVMNNKYHR